MKTSRIMWVVLVVLLSIVLAVYLIARGGGGGGVPAAPTGVTATAGDGRATISWSSVTGATSYNIYWSTTSGVTKTSGTKITGATSPYSHTGRTNGTRYYYIVTAVNSSGESVESSQVSATPTSASGGGGGGIPSAPTGVTATAGDGRATISWSSVTGATSYNIYWSTTSGVTKTRGTKITGATSPYSHTGLTNGMTYYYLVTAVNSKGESSESRQVSATPSSGGVVVSSILDNATFYNGPRPVPTNITFVDSYDNQVTMFGYPGQVNVIVPPRTEVSTVKALVEQHGGTILSQIPVLGLYLVQVPVGSESSFISAVRQNPIVLYAFPNSVLLTKTSVEVDLSDTGVTDPSKLVVALLRGPDPNAKVILVQLDDFNENHGALVEQEMNLITGAKNKLQLNIGLQLGDRLPYELSTNYYTSTDVLYRSMTAAIAGAELNNQKAVINLSFGWIGVTDDRNEFNDDTFMLKSQENWLRGMLLPLVNSDWAKGGNIFFSVAAGNDDVYLIDNNGNELQSRRLDITSMLNNLKADPDFGPVMKYVTFCGALDSTGDLADDSAYGDGVVYGYSHTPGYHGSSLIAPQGSGAAYNAWSTSPNLNSEQINQALQTAADKNLNAFGYPVLDVAGTITEAGVIAAGGTYTLTITKTGTGSGTVSASPPGPTYTAGTVVTLAATPDTGSTFAGWSGACSGTGSCVVTMDWDKSVTATFAPISSPLNGAWSGSYNAAAPGSGGWIYNDGGTLTWTISSVSGNSFSGSVYITGVQLRWVEGGAVAGYTSCSGTVSGTISGNVLEGTYEYYVSETEASSSWGFTATLSGNTIDGGRTTSTASLSFTLTRS
ncbi:MAG: fibronectin type III domain-containing protein [Dehalococcoidia bacterium]